MFNMFNRKIWEALENVKTEVKQLANEAGYKEALLEQRDWRMSDRVARLEEWEASSRTVVDCDACGCLVDKKMAVRGESKIVTETVVGFPQDVQRERIVTPYYCKRCAGEIANTATPDAVMSAQPTKRKRKPHANKTRPVSGKKVR